MNYIINVWCAYNALFARLLLDLGVCHFVNYLFFI